MNEEVPKPERQEDRRERFLINIQNVKSRLGEKEATVFFWDVLAKVNKNAGAQQPPIETSNYEAYHLLAGSSIDAKVESKGFDWEGPTSIVETLEKEIRDRGWRN